MSACCVYIVFALELGLVVPSCLPLLLGVFLSSGSYNTVEQRYRHDCESSVATGPVLSLVYDGASVQ